MEELAKIISIEKNGIVKILCLKSSVCINCTQEKICKFNKQFFYAKNPKNFSLKENDYVKVDCSNAAKIILGILALFFPLLCAVLGFFLSSKIAFLFNLFLSESVKFIISFLFFLVSASMIFILSKKQFHFTKPQIIQII